MELVYETESGTTTSLWIDTATEIAHEATATPTENPIERGASTADHVNQDPDTVSFECTVTNVPITVPLSNMDGVTGQVDSVELQGGSKASVLKFSGVFDRVRSVDQELLRLKRTATLLRVVGGGIRDYSNMVVRRYAPKEDVNTAKSLRFTLELKNIVISNSEIVEVPDPEEGRAREEESRGSVPAEDATGSRSFLRGLADRIAG